MGVFGGWEDTLEVCARESSEQRFRVKPVGVAGEGRMCKCLEFCWGLLPPARFKVELAFILEQLAMRAKNKVHQAQLWPPRGALGGQLALLGDLHRTIQRLQQIEG